MRTFSIGGESRRPSAITVDEDGRLLFENVAFRSPIGPPPKPSKSETKAAIKAAIKAVMWVDDQTLNGTSAWVRIIVPYGKGKQLATLGWARCMPADIPVFSERLGLAIAIGRAEHEAWKQLRVDSSGKLVLR